ncbi:MAG TPA: PhnD/SsuA/transferrin family substrate-binding protein [Candidatus Polarisedimenticolia bacterium]|nr:PhnD/SsuA/transferrin family substrate-binding protein [Candidatus Polarisedimenticolia bacterium]
MTDTGTAGSAPLVLGAVAYDPKVVTIWDGFRAWFEERGLPFDYVLFSNYERQVEAHCEAEIDVAWNSPLAWLQTERIAAATGRRAEAIAMRDTDQDLTSILIVRAGSEIAAIDGLRGRRVAVGAADSPQATLIPLGHLAAAGLEPGAAFEVLVFDRLPGKHGDHIGGERDAVRALVRGDADAACLIDSNHLLFSQDGTLPAGFARVLARTAPYDHCNFTILGGPTAKTSRFRELLLGMRYADPEVRALLDLEGLKEWRPGRTSGYAPLAVAVDRFGTIESFVARVAARCR